LQLELITDDISEQVVVDSSCNSSEEEEEVAEEDGGGITWSGSLVKCSPATSGNSVGSNVFMFSSREKNFPLLNSPLAHLTADMLPKAIIHLIWKFFSIS
jgi:hypothetical protein